MNNVPNIEFSREEAFRETSDVYYSATKVQWPRCTRNPVHKVVVVVVVVQLMLKGIATLPLFTEIVMKSSEDEEG